VLFLSRCLLLPLRHSKGPANQLHGRGAIPNVVTIREACKDRGRFGRNNHVLSSREDDANPHEFLYPEYP
jgi:hypothetical protein